MSFLAVVGSFGWPSSDPEHARFHLDTKPQMVDALQFAQHSYCPSGLVIDVGANGGKEAMAAAYFGYDVLSVECLVSEYSRLAEIWKDNPKITLINGCASNRLGLQTFHLASGSSSLHKEAISDGSERDKASSDGFKTSRTLTFPLDQLVESYAKRLCVLKIDTQGHELMVMEGLRSSIERYRPVIIFEWDPRFGPFVNMTIPWIRSLSYDCAVPGALPTTCHYGRVQAAASCPCLKTCPCSQCRAKHRSATARCVMCFACLMSSCGTRTRRI